jgi:hypothetical protein
MIRSFRLRINTPATEAVVHAGTRKHPIEVNVYPKGDGTFYVSGTGLGRETFETRQTFQAACEWACTWAGTVGGEG